MTTTRHARMFLAALLALFPAGIFAQAADRQVALIPFWGDNEYAISRFGEALYSGLSEMGGFHPTWVDAAAIPPELRFPPFLPPSPILTGDAPLAVTGDVFVDPLSGLWRLQLYLWHTSPLRLLFSDGMVAFDWDIVDMIMPITLEDIFSWAPEYPPPQVIVVPVPYPPPPVAPPAPYPPPAGDVPVPPPAIVYYYYYPQPGAEPPPPEAYYPMPAPIAPPPAAREDPRDAAERARRPMPALFVGAWAGGSMRMFDPQWSDDRLNFDHMRNFSVGASLNSQFRFIEIFNFGLFWTPQIEVFYTRDFGNSARSLTFPVLMRLTARTDSWFFSPLAGFHGSVRIGDGSGDRFAFGYTVGLRGGTRFIGPGYIFLDGRWSQDLRADDFRGIASVSVGYEFRLPIWR